MNADLLAPRSKTGSRLVCNAETLLFSLPLGGPWIGLSAKPNTALFSTGQYQSSSRF
jgi:hypothetical protein